MSGGGPNSASSSILSWGRDLVASNRRSDGGIPPDAVRRPNQRTPEQVTEATQPHWRRAEQIRQRQRTTAQSGTSTLSPAGGPRERPGSAADGPLSSNASFGGEAAASSSRAVSGRSTPQGASVASNPPSPSPAALGSRGAGHFPASQNHPSLGSDELLGRPVKPRGPGSATSGFSAASPSDGHVDGGRLVSGTPSVVSSVAAAGAASGAPVAAAVAASSEDEIAAALVEIEAERDRENKLQAMLDRNRKEFESRETQLLAALEAASAQSESIGAGSATSVPSPRPHDQRIRQLEEELWETETALQKLLDDEATEGAAVVRMADTISDCETRAKSAEDRVAVSLKEAHRLLQLVHENRDVAKRVPSVDSGGGQQQLLLLLDLPDAHEAAEVLQNLTANQKTIGTTGSPSRGGLNHVPNAEELRTICGPDFVASTAEALASAAQRLGPVLDGTFRLTDQKADALQKVLDALNSQLELQAATMDEAHETLLVLAEKKQRQLENIEETNFQIQKLEEEADAKAGTVSTLQADVRAAENAAEAAKQRVRDTEGNAISREHEAATNVKERQRAEAAAREHEGRAAEFANQRRATQGDSDAIEQEVAALQRQLRSCESAEEDLRRDLARADARSTGHKEEVSTQEQRLREAKTGLDRAEQETLRLQRSAKDAIAEAEDIEYAMKSLMPRGIEGAREEIATARRELSDAEVELRQVEDDLAAAESEGNDIKGEIEVAKVVILHKQEMARPIVPDPAVSSPPSRIMTADTSSTLPDASPAGLREALAQLGEPQAVASTPPAGTPVMSRAQTPPVGQPATHSAAMTPPVAPMTSPSPPAASQLPDFMDEASQPPSFSHTYDPPAGTQQPPLGPSATGRPAVPASHFQDVLAQQRTVSRRRQWSRSPSSSLERGASAERQQQPPHQGGYAVVQQPPQALIHSDRVVETVPVQSDAAPMLVTMQPRRVTAPAVPLPAPESQGRPFPWQGPQEEAHQPAYGAPLQPSAPVYDSALHQHEFMGEPYAMQGTAAAGAPRHVDLAARSGNGGDGASLVSLASSGAPGDMPRITGSYDARSGALDRREVDTNTPPDAQFRSSAAAAPVASSPAAASHLASLSGDVYTPGTTQSAGAAYGGSTGIPEATASFPMGGSSGAPAGGGGATVRPELHDRLSSIQNRLDDVLRGKKRAPPVTPSVRQ